MAIDITRLNKISEAFSGPMGYNPGEYLSDNFQLSEFLKSSSATAQGIDNTPTEDVVNNLRTLARSLQVIRDETGPIAITSGYRSKALQDYLQKSGNKNAVEYSLHTYGMAADIAPAKGNKFENNLKAFYAAIVTREDLLSLFGAVVILPDKGILHTELPSIDAFGNEKYAVPMYEGDDGQYYRFKTDAELSNYLSDVMESVSTFVAENKMSVGLIIGLIAALGIGGFLLYKNFSKKGKK